MTLKKLTTRQGDTTQARSRRRIAHKYYEVADLIAIEDGAAINVICLAGTGERYSGQDHAAAAQLLTRVDAGMGRHLQALVALKPASHYGDRLLGTRDRTAALRAAKALVDEAARRTS